MRNIGGNGFDATYIEGNKWCRELVPVWRIPTSPGSHYCVASKNKRDTMLCRSWIKAEQKKKSKDGWHVVKEPI